MRYGVQQIMVGTLCSSPKKAAETLKAIKAMGYDGIELNRFMIHPTSFLVRALTSLAGMPTGKGGSLPWKSLIQESGLDVISLHADIGSLERETNEIIAEARSFATDTIVVTGMYRFAYDSQEALDDLCQKLNALGETLEREGIHLLYHNHNVEWKKLSNGETAFEYLVEHLDEKYVNFEFDSYWPAEAGVNVYKVAKELGPRMRKWHINDRGNREKGPFMTPIRKNDCVELGTGAMDLDLLMKIAKESGVDDIVLEQHRNFINKSPLESIGLSMEFFKIKKEDAK